MKQIKQRLIVTIILLLLVINGVIIYQTVFKKDLDLWVSKVSTEEVRDKYQYQITLKSTEPVEQTASLQLVYEDGSEEVLSDVRMDRKTKQVKVTSAKRLEHLYLQTPPELGEGDLTNNHYNPNLWSRNLAVLESYSVPEYDYLRDQQGRVWLAVTGKRGANGFPAASLTVLDADGEFLVQEKVVSPTGVYSGKPMLRQTADGRVHMIWSSFIDEADVLFHTSFRWEDGEVTQGIREKITEEGLSLSWPVFLQNNLEENLILVQTEKPSKSGFALYQLDDAGRLVKVKQIQKLVQPDQQTVEVDAAELEKYGISLEEWLAYNNQEVDTDYFEARFFKDLIFLQDQQGNYLIIWAEEYSRTTEVFFCKLDPELNVVIPRKKIFNPLTTYLDLDLTIKPQGDHLVFFWTEIDNAVHGQNQLVYATFSEDGEQIGEKHLITGPYPWPIQHLSVDQDQQGNFNLVWSDIRLSSSIRPNRELTFQKLSSDFQVLIPYYNVSQDLADQLHPELKMEQGHKFLFWLNFNDNKYQLYVRSSDPQFIQGLDNRLKRRDAVDSLIYWFELLFLSFGAQLFFIVSLNSFPVLGFMSTLILCTFFWMHDHWKNWAVVLLTLLVLKFATLGVFQKSAFLVQDNSYLASTLIFLVVCLAFGMIQLRRKNPKFEHKLYLILVWMFVDSYVQVFLYYFAGLPK